jgi:hypothetical protein
MSTRLSNSRRGYKLRTSLAMSLRSSPASSRAISYAGEGAILVVMRRHLIRTLPERKLDKLL